MNKEEKELINNIERALNLSEVKGDLVTIIYNYIVKATINLINKLQKELEQEKEKNKKLNLENQALFESINCNDDNMLVRRYQKLQKENEKLKYKIEGRDCVIETQGYNEDALLETMSKKDKLIELIYNLFYEYISIRPMSGIKFLNDKGFSKCKNCEEELEDENGISCKDCIKEEFFKKVEEENES